MRTLDRGPQQAIGPYGVRLTGILPAFAVFEAADTGNSHLNISI